MKRKILLLVTCLALVMTTVVAPISAYASTYQILKVNTGAYLRSGPKGGDSGYPIVKTLKKGTKVIWKGTKKGAFLKVYTASGVEGYIFRDYVSSYGAVNSKSLYKAKSSAKIYKKPSTSSGKVASVSSGEYVMVYATQGGWAYVKNTSGKGGYMKVSSLKKG